MNTSTKPKIKIHIIPILIIGLLTAFDQLTKFIITSSFELYESKPAIKNFLSFTYIQNRGMAWGMLQGKRVIFVALTIVILLLCFAIYSNIADKSKYRILRANMIILIAGALGNMLDRIKLGYVIDFFEVKFIEFPVFNVADIYVVVSMIMIFILIMFKYSNEEFDEILGISKKVPDIKTEKDFDEDVEESSEETQEIEE